MTGSLDESLSGAAHASASARPCDGSLHIAFLEGLREQGSVELSGGFSDNSGGAYLLHAAGLTEATAIAHSDQAHVSGGWDVTVYEWQAH